MLADVASSKSKLHKVTLLTIIKAQTISDALPYVVFKVVVSIVGVLFVKQRLVLRETDNELLDVNKKWCYI